MVHPLFMLRTRPAPSRQRRDPNTTSANRKTHHLAAVLSAQNSLRVRRQENQAAAQGMLPRTTRYIRATAAPPLRLPFPAPPPHCRTGTPKQTRPAALSLGSRRASLGGAAASRHVALPASERHGARNSVGRAPRALRPRNETEPRKASAGLGPACGDVRRCAFHQEFGGTCAGKDGQAGHGGIPLCLVQSRHPKHRRASDS